MKRNRNMRTNLCKEHNNNILRDIFEKYQDESGKTASGFDGHELTKMGYIGSLPYSAPTGYKDFAIRQIGSFNGLDSKYSILKISDKHEK